LTDGSKCNPSEYKKKKISDNRIKLITGMMATLISDSEKRIGSENLKSFLVEENNENYDSLFKYL